MGNEGITVIALVITIIVLLILAGVSATMIAGDNGILTKATSVEIQYTKSEIEEAMEMLVNQKLMEAYEAIKDTSDDISKYYNEVDLIAYLKNNNYIREITYGSSTSVNNETIAKVYCIEVGAFPNNEYRYGTGTFSETDANERADVFTLEVIEDGSGKSTGIYKLVYYDEDGNPEILTEIALYLTNES